MGLHGDFLVRVLGYGMAVHDTVHRRMNKVENLIVRARVPVFLVFEDIFECEHTS